MFSWDDSLSSGLLAQAQHRAHKPLSLAFFCTPAMLFFCGTHHVSQCQHTHPQVAVYAVLHKGNDQLNSSAPCGTSASVNGLAPICNMLQFVNKCHGLYPVQILVFPICITNEDTESSLCLGRDYSFNSIAIHYSQEYNVMYVTLFLP